MKGLVSQIQRFSVSDGPGVRTTVFLKGCPLRCLWCHNPETQDTKPSLLYYEAKCIHCGLCAAVCPEGANTLENGVHALTRLTCVKCGMCANVCPKSALELRGQAMSVEEVLEPVLRDKAFYQTTGGGVTISGGEPLAQIAFTISILQAAKEAGLHTCLDTSGWGGRAIALLPWVDLYLWDIKETDAKRHKQVTGVALDAILESLFAVDAAGGAIRLRCPIVPGVNDRSDHMQSIGMLADHLKCVQGIDLIPYHDLGSAKALAMGVNTPSFTSLSREDQISLLASLNESTKAQCCWHH